MQMFGSMLEMSEVYSGGRGGSSSTTVIVILILALAATVALFILVLPDSKRNMLPPFLQRVADFFNLKYLLIEKIFKGIYVFLTVFVLLFGIATLFQDFTTGLLLMVFGPIAVRIIHELLMLLILAVNNLMEMNHKMGPKPGTGSQKSEPSGSRKAFAQGGQEYNYGARQGQYSAPQQPAPTQTYGGQGTYYGSRQNTAPQQNMMPQQQNMAPQQQQYTGGYSYAGQAEPRTRRVNR